MAIHYQHICLTLFTRHTHAPPSLHSAVRGLRGVCATLGESRGRASYVLSTPYADQFVVVAVVAGHPLRMHNISQFMERGMQNK